MSNPAQIALTCQVRDKTGKGNTRRLRRQDGIPAILYGGDAAPQMLTIASNDWKKISTRDEIYTEIFQLDIAGNMNKVILKSIQRQPTTSMPMHIDFFRADVTVETVRTLPVKLLNEELCEGVKLSGGIIVRQMNEVALKGKLNELPSFIEIDMEKVAISESIRLSDLDLPSNVQIPALIRGNDQVIVGVSSKRGLLASEMDEDEVAEETEEVKEES